MAADHFPQNMEKDIPTCSNNDQKQRILVLVDDVDSQFFGEATSFWTQILPDVWENLDFFLVS